MQTWRDRLSFRTQAEGRESAGAALVPDLGLKIAWRHHDL
jgi:hypothetical protein